MSFVAAAARKHNFVSGSTFRTDRLCVQLLCSASRPFTPNSCRHDCNLKCLIVQLSASTIRHATLLQKYRNIPSLSNTATAALLAFFFSFGSARVQFCLCSVQLVFASVCVLFKLLFGSARVQFCLCWVQLVFGSPGSVLVLARLPTASALLRGRAPLFLDS